MKPTTLAGRLLACLILLAAGHFGYLYISGNFHAVLPGELYRSAQVTPGSLADYQQRYGIRTVVNLRGVGTGARWYSREVGAARRLGLMHLDFRMSARQQLSPARAAELVAMLRDVPKPILIHCQSGADRSGLVSALYLAAIAGAGEKKAEEQLSIRFGHIAIPVLSRAYAMDETWEALEPWLGFAGS